MGLCLPPRCSRVAVEEPGTALDLPCAPRALGCALVCTGVEPVPEPRRVWIRLGFGTLLGPGVCPREQAAGPAAAESTVALLNLFI